MYTQVSSENASQQTNVIPGPCSLKKHKPSTCHRMQRVFNNEKQTLLKVNIWVLIKNHLLSQSSNIMKRHWKMGRSSALNKLAQYVVQSMANHPYLQRIMRNAETINFKVISTGAQPSLSMIQNINSDRISS